MTRRETPDEPKGSEERTGPDPTRRRALKLMALSASTPLLAQILAACGSSPAEPGEEEEE
jgi:hypothetical protein